MKNSSSTFIFLFSILTFSKWFSPFIFDFVHERANFMTIDGLEVVIMIALILLKYLLLKLWGKR